MSNATHHVPRARLRAEAHAGARRISLAHLAKLREIVKHAGTLHAALPMLRASPDTVSDALSGKVFKRSSAEAFEAKVDCVDLAAWPAVRRRRRSRAELASLRETSVTAPPR